MTRDQAITAFGIITIILGIISIITSVALNNARDKINILESRIQAIEMSGVAYSRTNKDGSIFVKETNGVMRWYRSAADMPITNSIISLEFVDGVRYGLIAKSQHPDEDSIWKLTVIANQWRNMISNAVVTNHFAP